MTLIYSRLHGSLADQSLWEVHELSPAPNHRHRIACNRTASTVHLLVDTAEDLYDPDVAIPQRVIDLVYNYNTPAQQQWHDSLAERSKTT